MSVSVETLFEAIKDVICDGGTPCASCDFCDRFHFAGSGDYMDEGELDGYLEQAKKHPEKYIERNDGDSIGVGEIEGRRYVWNCGCKQSEKRLTKIAQFLYCHERMVLQFFRKLSDEMKAEAEMIAKKLPVR